MPELLLELLSEEIPARMQAEAADRLREYIIELLDQENLGNLENYLVSVENVVTFVTPRRLVAVAQNIRSSQPDIEIERKGPRVGAPEKAIQGFLKGVGFQSIEQCEQRETPKGPAWFAVIQRKGRPTVEVLKKKLPDLVSAFSWPKSMRWRNTAVRWVRPLHGVLCVFDGKAVPGEIGFASTIPEEAQIVIPFTNTTVGHRFMAPKSFPVPEFAYYNSMLKKAFVILKSEERRIKIIAESSKLANDRDCQVPMHPGLLDEVVGLTEWPIPLIGQFEPEFLKLPEEVLETSMRVHQKYFSVRKISSDGKTSEIAPYFVFVANTEATDGGKAIIAGNERVLRARLADARYFWDQDRKRSLDGRVADLDGMVFQQSLGTVLQKAERMGKLARALAETTGADADLAERAARLAKADLTTEMVVEFPGLQGIMGRYYALADGEPAEVAEAINDHYAPQGPTDRCPSAPVSVAVALADKIDTLIGFWGIDEKPTGSKDPFALRRAAISVIRLILENRLRVNLHALFERCGQIYEEVKEETLGKSLIEQDSKKAEEREKLGEASYFGFRIYDDLLDFFADRLKVHLRDKGVRHDLVTAVFSLGGEDDLVRLLARVEALEGFLASGDGEPLLVAYKRAANIVAIEEKKDGVAYDQSVDAGRLVDAEEVSLHAGLEDAAPRITKAVAEERFADAMLALAGLRAPVDAFFDKVTVNCDDKALRANRLRLLSRIRGALGGVADFSKIEG